MTIDTRVCDKHPEAGWYIYPHGKKAPECAACRNGWHTVNNARTNLETHPLTNPRDAQFRKLLTMSNEGIFLKPGAVMSVNLSLYGDTVLKGLDGQTATQWKNSWTGPGVRCAPISLIDRLNALPKLVANGIAPEAYNTVANIQGGTRVVLRRHDQLKRVITILIQDSGNRVGHEQDTVTGCIDIIAYFGEDLVLYELKIKDTAYECFKAAVGQLVVYFLETGSTAKRLIVAGPVPTDEATEKQLAMMRAKGFPMEYQCYPFSDGAEAAAA